MLKQKIAALGSNRYYVYRGPINWAKFDFAAHPFAVAIMFDETAFLRASNPAILTLEFFTTMPDMPGEGEQQLDDSGIDQLYADATAVIESLETERNPTDAAIPLINKLDRTRDKIIESSDVNLKVQGIIASVFIEY